MSKAIFRVPWKIVTVISVTLGIFASSIGIYSFLKVDQLEQLATQAQDWALDIRLDEPRGGLATSVRITGKAEFRTAANENRTASRVNLSLYQKKISLICLVRAVLKKQCLWYQQASPVVYADGSFEGLAFLADEDSDSGFGVEHQIIVLAVPIRPEVKTRTYQDLPFYIVASRIVSVKADKSGKNHSR